MALPENSQSFSADYWKRLVPNNNSNAYVTDKSKGLFLLLSVYGILWRFQKTADPFRLISGKRLVPNNNSTAY
jgi:hypothetical protein